MQCERNIAWHVTAELTANFFFNIWVYTIWFTEILFLRSKELENVVSCRRGGVWYEYCFICYQVGFWVSSGLLVPRRSVGSIIKLGSLISVSVFHFLKFLALHSWIRFCRSVIGLNFLILGTYSNYKVMVLKFQVSGYEFSGF